MRFEQFFTERYGQQRQLNGIWYHGTSSVHLRSILKKGLTTDAKKSWDSDSSASYYSVDLTSYGGIYASRLIEPSHIAATRVIGKVGGNRLIVVMTLQPKTLIADEDDLSHLYDSDRMTTKGIRVNDFNLYKSIIVGDQGSPDDQSRYANVRDKWVYEAMRYLVGYLHGRDAVHQSIQDKLKSTLHETGFRAVVTRAVSFSPSHKIWDEMWDDSEVPPLPTRQEGEAVFRDFIDVLTKLLRKIVYHRGRTVTSGRSLENIGFSGRNRIIAIIEVSDKDSELIVRYGKIPTTTLVDYIETIDSDIRVRDVDGAVTRPKGAHFSI